MKDDAPKDEYAEVVKFADKGSSDLASGIVVNCKQVSQADLMGKQ